MTNLSLFLITEKTNHSHLYLFINEIRLKDAAIRLRGVGDTTAIAFTSRFIVNEHRSSFKVKLQEERDNAREGVYTIINLFKKESKFNINAYKILNLFTSLTVLVP